MKLERQHLVALLLVVIVSSYVSVCASASPKKAVIQTPVETPITSVLEEDDKIYYDPFDTAHQGSPEEYIFGTLEFYHHADCDRIGCVVMVDEEALAEWVGLSLSCYGVTPEEIAKSIVKKASQVYYEKYEIFLVPAKVIFWDSPDDIRADSVQYLDAALNAANWSRGTFIGWQFVGLDYYIPVYQDVLVLITMQKIGTGTFTWAGTGLDCDPTGKYKYDSIAIIHLQWFSADKNVLGHEIGHVLGCDDHYTNENCIMTLYGYQWGCPMGYLRSDFCSVCLQRIRDRIAQEYTHPPPPFDPTKIF